MMAVCIHRPRDTPGIMAQTPEQYREVQRKWLRLNPLAPNEPWSSFEPIAAYIGAGTWRVRCACGDAPSADPDWRLACCAGCGAMHDRVVFPPEWEAIEAVLVLRRVQRTRNWDCLRPETVDALRADNLLHGDPVI